MNGIDVLIGIQPVYLKSIYVCVFHTSIDCKAHTFHNLTTKHNLTLKSGCVIYSHAQITTDSFFLFLGPPPRDLPVMEPMSLMSSALAGKFCKAIILQLKNR